MAGALGEHIGFCSTNSFQTISYRVRDDGAKRGKAELGVVEDHVVEVLTDSGSGKRLC